MTFEKLIAGLSNTLAISDDTSERRRGFGLSDSGKYRALTQPKRARYTRLGIGYPEIE